MHDEYPTEPSEPSAESTAQPDTVTPDQVPTSPEASGPFTEDEDGPGDVSNELEQTRQERDEHYKKLLETAAELENYRKDVRKSEERKRREHDYQVTSELMNEILPVIDDLERALAAPEGSGYRRGVELIHKQLLDLIDKHEVTAIEAIGSDFDPNRHEAVQHEPSDAHRDGEVIEEFRRGYMLRDKLLRPSMVKVAKA